MTAGGADTYLKDKDQIDFTQSAFVLENLIGQVLANFTKSKADEHRRVPRPRRKRRTQKRLPTETDGKNEMIKIR